MNPPSVVSLAGCSGCVTSGSSLSMEVVDAVVKCMCLQRTSNLSPEIKNNNAAVNHLEDKTVTICNDHSCCLLYCFIVLYWWAHLSFQSFWINSKRRRAESFEACCQSDMDYMNLCVMGVGHTEHRVSTTFLTRKNWQFVLFRMVIQFIINNNNNNEL